MTVTSKQLHWTGATGKRSGTATNEKSEYTAVFLVQTSDPLDQPETIIAYFKANGPYLGAAYSYGNDYNSAAILLSINPQRSRESSTTWLVSCSYGPAESGSGEQEKPDNEGNSTNDPTQWADEVSISSATIRVPVYKAIHRGGIMDMDDGKVVCPQNSAGLILVPGLEKEVKLRAVRITKYRTLFDGFESDQYLGLVNSDNFQVTKAQPNYVDRWPPHTAYISEWGGSSEFINGISIWRITVEILVNKLTWWEEVIDRGLHARAKPGDPDGRGGTISLTDILAGNVPVRRLVDKFNKPITEPVLLNGLGSAKEEGEEPHFIKYQIYGERTFTGLPI